MGVTKHQALPEQSLLQRYVDSGDFTDCYSLDIQQPVSFEQYVEAFYCSWLFKLERWILTWAVRRPSTDAQAKQLALGTAKQFAAWDVEDRLDQQLLMCDLHQRTRSWLRSCATPTGTRLYFGSAVVKQSGGKENPKMGFVFAALSGFHALYSRALLRAAKARLAK